MSTHLPLMKDTIYETSMTRQLPAATSLTAQAKLYQRKVWDITSAFTLLMHTLASQHRKANQVKMAKAPTVEEAVNPQTSCNHVRIPMRNSS
jgi:hypothetical protein